jgi:SAM-dependent methyltransferase
MMSSLQHHPTSLGRRMVLGSLLAIAPASLAGQDTAAAGAAAVPRRSPDVHFVPTEMGTVHTMLKVAKVGKSDIVYDLGCGDGRIVITAVKEYGARRGVCVDIDPERIKESRLKADSAGVTKRISFREADLFQMDLSDATVVTLYLLPALNERLRPKLFRELKPGTRVTSNSFDMGDWKADSVIQPSPRSQFFNYAYFWIIPADVAGTWTVNLDRSGESNGDGSAYTLDLEQRYQQVTGKATANGREISLDEVSLRGDRLNFVISDPKSGNGGPMRFTGRISGDKATGTVKSGASEGTSASWAATRTKKGPRPEIRDTTSGR